MQRPARARVRAIATVERMSHAPAMRCHAFVLTAVVSSFSGSVHSQTWSVTATAPVVGTATATISSTVAPPVTVNASLPIGPVAQGVFFQNSASLVAGGGSGSAMSSADWLASVPGQTAPLAFRVHTRSLVNGTPPSGPNVLVEMTNLDATLRLSLQAPQPASGRLFVRYRGVICDFGTGQVHFDVDADGTVELSCAPTSGCSPNPPWSLVDLPLAIPATGKLLQLTIHTACGANATHGGHGATLEVEAQFFPGQSIVQTFNTAGASAVLFAEHRVDDTVFLAAGYGGYTPAAFLVFGVQPMAVMITPTLVQLVSVDAFAPAPFTALMPPMPPGASLYCQGLVIDTTGTMRGTRSLRALWP